MLYAADISVASPYDFLPPLLLPLHLALMTLAINLVHSPLLHSVHWAGVSLPHLLSGVQRGKADGIKLEGRLQFP